MATDKKKGPQREPDSKAGRRPLPPPRPSDKQLTIDKSWGCQHTKPNPSKEK